MLNKKLMILAIFLVSLFAVSAVSAAENATEDIIADVAGEDVSITIIATGLSDATLTPSAEKPKTSTVFQKKPLL